MLSIAPKEERTQKLRRFIPDRLTAQFPQIPVRVLEKSAPKQIHYDAAADASSVAKLLSKIRIGRLRVVE